jgi:Leucine rich repeat
MSLLSLIRDSLGFQDKRMSLSKLSDRTQEEILADRLKFIRNFEDNWDCIVDEILQDADRKSMLTIGDYTMTRYRELPWIPKAIGRLVHLEELTIKTTKPWPTGITEYSTEMPESFGDLVHLKHLNLRGSKITKLPESIGNLSNLVSLDLQDTLLTSLPDSFGNLKNLKRLSLFATSVNDFTILQHLPNLQEIQLGGDIRYWGDGGSCLADFKLKYCTNISEWSERDRQMIENHRTSRSSS